MMILSLTLVIGVERSPGYSAGHDSEAKYKLYQTQESLYVYFTESLLPFIYEKWYPFSKQVFSNSNIGQRLPSQ